jgi:hypothetical protein
METQIFTMQKCNLQKNPHFKIDLLPKEPKSLQLLLYLNLNTIIFALVGKDKKDLPQGL